MTSVIISTDEDQYIVPSQEAWEKLMQNPIFQGLPIYNELTERSIRNFVDIAQKNRDKFCIGLKREKWLPSQWCAVPFIKMEYGWQPIQFEYICCDHCDWGGYGANPSLPDLYRGPKSLELAVKASQLPRANCPKCKNKLSRFVIWTDTNGAQNE